MAKTSMAQRAVPRVTVGVDTHLDSHVARAKDQLGRRLAEREIPATPAGYRQLLEWAKSLGEVEAFGVEGTGSYGAGLARYLRQEGQVVLEVIRPNRQARRRNGKSDPADADAAASAALSGDASAVPKAGDAMVEMIRVLRVARSTAIKARTQAVNALKALVVTAPASLRESVRGLGNTQLVATCARLRADQLADPEGATKLAMRHLARRYQALDAEAQALTVEIDRLVARAAPQLLALFGVGPECAAALLITAGDNPHRLRSEAAFSMLCGASPVQASSGKVVRHRLNRGGDRQGNAALHRVVITRLRWHQPTQHYMERRTKEGKSKTEIIRCLKRYVAREVFYILVGIEANSSSAVA
jgi:transposase